MWKILQSHEILKTGFFRLRRDECELKDGRVHPRYYVMEFSSWVQIVALTKNREMVLVRQYRHAAGLEFLEVPGGSVDGRQSEAPLEAAKRELREETGFVSDHWRQLGEFFPNPAIQSNRLFVYLALDCEKIGEPQLDPFEELTAEVMPVKEVYQLLDAGKFQHALVSACLAMARAHLLGVSS